MSAHSPASLQVEVKLRVPNGVELTEQFIEQVIQRWADTGESPKGITVRLIDWSHGKGRHNVKQQTETRLRFRRLLQAGSYSVHLRNH